MKSIIISIVLISLLASSCRVNKNLSVAHTKTDSAYQSTVDSFHHVIDRMEQEKTKAVANAKKAQVQFTTNCPDTADLQALRQKLDSAGKVILDQFAKENQQKTTISNLQNKIKVNADGSFELSGQIQSANLELWSKTVETSYLRYLKDSLERVNKVLLGSLTKEILDKKKIKSSKPAVGGYIIALLIGIVLGFLIRTFITINKNLTLMKSMKSIVVIMLLGGLCLLESCGGKFKDGTSVWAEGLWLVPTVFYLLGASLVIRAYIGSKSGSWQQDRVKGIQYSDKNVPIYKNIFYFWGGIVCLLLGIGLQIGINYWRA